MENKFTPGPWSYRENEDDFSIYFDDSGDGCEDACVLKSDAEDDNAIENTGLMVCAPDLLAACEAALIFLNEEEYYQKSSEMTFVLEKLREASAKAKGE